jgi:phosphotransferase system HPr (HPr) family protein
MQAQPLIERVTIANPQGLHLRPATILAITAQKFVSDIWLIASGQRINGKSLWELISLGAACGTELIVEVVGSDAPLALAAVVDILSTASPEEDMDSLSPG